MMFCAFLFEGWRGHFYFVSSRNMSDYRQQIESDELAS